MNNIILQDKAASVCTKEISVLTGKAPALPGFFIQVINKSIPYVQE
jgi:hypothetical protein